MKPKIICGVLALVVCFGIFAGCKREKVIDETTSSTQSTTTQSATESTTESTTTETETETKTTIKKVAKTTEKAYKKSTTTTLTTQPETTQETTAEVPEVVPEETTTEPLNGRITLEQFNQVQLGMSYEQVCEIFGKPADSAIQRSKYSPKCCYWMNKMEQLGVDSQGAILYPHIFAVFSSNELTEIRQKGLR